MTTSIDQPRATEHEPAEHEPAEHEPAEHEPEQPEAAHAAELPALTPEEARRLAAILAPHLVAMRAVIAGTRYEYTADGEDALVSTAVKIFIAGMLQRLPA